MLKQKNLMQSHSTLCKAESSLLLVVDVQTKLTAAMTTANADNMLTCSTRLIQSADIMKVPVFITEQYPQGLGTTVSNLTDILPGSTAKFTKTGFSCCAASGFKQALANSQRKQVILVGQETHVCILQTALELLESGYHVFVAEDAVCSRRPEHKTWALHRMQQNGITITNHESVLFEWLKDASHPDFKTISGFLR